MDILTTYDWEIQAYGETAEQVMAAVSHYKDDPVLMISYATGILSDAQHVLNKGRNSLSVRQSDAAETARQYMNKAKLIMSEATRIIREQERAEEGVPFKSLEDGQWFICAGTTAMKIPTLSDSEGHQIRTHVRYQWNAVSADGELLKFDDGDLVHLVEKNES